MHCRERNGGEPESEETEGKTEGVKDLRPRRIMAKPPGSISSTAELPERGDWGGVVRTYGQWPKEERKGSAEGIYRASGCSERGGVGGR